MMRSSSLVAGVVVLVAISGCGIDPKPQLLFEDTSQPPKIATRDWNGEAVTIRNEGIDDGVNPPSALGGVEVRVSPSATKVSVEAVFAAYADPDKRPNAEQSMSDATKTFTLVENAASFDITCGHGGTYGTSRGAGSGCKLLRVTIPAGSAAQPHALSIETGSGAIRIHDAPWVKTLLADNTGPSEIEVRLRPVKDAMLRMTGESAVSVSLPGDFSARKVVLTVDAASSAEIAPGIITTDFAGLTSGAPYPTTGPREDAAAELDARSKGGLAADLLRITKLP